MSEDEKAVLFFSGVMAVIGWGWFFIRTAFVARFPGRFRGRGVLWAAPFLCAAFLFVLLKLFSAEDVRDDPDYLAFYMLLGAAWLIAGQTPLPLLGLSFRDDVLERGNRAASYAIAGAFFGITLCYAGGNAGNGPGWWVVVFSAALSTAALLLLWTAFASLTALADRIAIDRDEAAGLRAVGFFVGCGLVLGRAVAGDWISASATLTDFVSLAWPAGLLTMGAAAMERAVRPAAERGPAPAFSCGLLPGLVLAGAGAIAVVLLGPW
jgi:uncharacterized membrane protein YjfL (UPF0719 family)